MRRGMDGIGVMRVVEGEGANDYLTGRDMGEE